VVERVGLTGLVAELAVQRRRLGERGDGGRVIAGQLLQQAELVERPGLAGPVARAAGRTERRLVLARGLVPVTAGPQEAADRRGDGDGVAGTGLGRERDRRVQVGPLGLQPRARFVRGGQLRGLRGRVSRRRPAAGSVIRWWSYSSSSRVRAASRPMSSSAAATDRFSARMTASRSRAAARLEASSAALRAG
jgi:hypothetical protein